MNKKVAKPGNPTTKKEVVHKTCLLTQRKDETFERIKVDNVVSLILQTEQIKLEEAIVRRAVQQHNIDQEECNDSSLASREFRRHLDEQGVKGVQSQRASYLSVISGYGESDFKPDERESGEADTKRADATKPKFVGPCLILDVRPADEFSQCHIITARNYPYTLLARANTLETSEMLAYKNTPGKLIILYDAIEAESQSVRAVETFVQRGYDNAVLMTGGLCKAYAKYPTGLICGKIPDAVVSFNSAKPHSGKNRPNFEMKDEYTEEDICSLQEQLRHNLLPKYAKSRLYRDTASSKNHRTNPSERWKL